MALAIHAQHHEAVEIEERRVHATEHALFHPFRRSIVSITNQSLQEIDPQHGSIIGETAFDLMFLASSNGGNASSIPPTSRQIEHVTPVGSRHVVCVFQSRCLVVWDLHDAVLQSVTEIEKQQKSIAAVAASLCKAKWLFYASEGSNSIKVSSVDSKDPPKKISRKASNRSSQLTSLAYDTPSRILCAGASDGALQLWIFSEENSLGGKEEAAQVTPLFVTQTTQAPVVQMRFLVSSGVTYLVVGYQNRVVEVWGIAPLPPRQREPYRAAVLHCIAPQVADFGRKSGDLSFLLHTQTPALTIGWQGYNGGGSWATCTELRVGATATAAVTLSNWHELLPSSSHDDGNAVVLYASSSAPPSAPLMAYVSTNHHHRQLLPLDVSSPQLSATAEDTRSLSLSTGFQLSLDQYFKYQDVPSTLLQVTRNADSSTPQATVYQLQRYSLTTGEVEKLDDLPVWNNYQGRQLVPWRLRWSEAQSALCVQLRNPFKATSDADDGSFSYVVVELKAKSKGVADADSEGGGSNVAVNCGSVQDALDVCFCDLRPDDAKQNRPFVLLVLASSGKSLGFQFTCDTVDANLRVLLHRPVRRVWSTPFPLPPSATHASTVGSRLLYMLASDSDGKQTLVLSDDDLSVPRSITPGNSFTTRSSSEHIVDVIWNSSATHEGMKALAAVWTTHRIVVLAGLSLSIIAEYDLLHELSSPHSVLWLAQTLLFVTSDRQLRYVTPLRTDSTKTATSSQLLCSLPTYDALKLQLLSVCGDRLCFAATDPVSLETKLLLRPIAVCEPLLLGYSELADGRLKAIFERDFLVFLQSGGLETLCPATDRLLEVMYHEFGWTDTVAKALDAMLNRSSAASAGVDASSGSATATISSYKKLSHLSPTTVASLLLHAHKWRDAVRVFLANDPALEEYALAEDESASSAKLPSRTGATAQHMHRLATVLASVGQVELAVKCLDVAGDDLAIVELLRAQAADATASQSVLSSLQKDWAKLNPPLAAVTDTTSPVPAAASQRRRDLFSLLCCEQLAQTERRSRLLSSVRPLDKLNVAVENRLKPKQATQPVGRAGILYWKRLSPEDNRDTVGLSTTPHFSTDEPKNPTNYSLFYGASGSSSLLGGDGDGDAGIGVDPAAQATTASSSADASAKMTIGPFLEDEDAVVAYWRFEEGATAGDDESKRTLESMDTTKRENHVQIASFSSLMAFATCTAPVDKGEEGKLQEAFSLRFPVAAVCGDSDPDEWGAKCAVRAGSTLDVGFVFDEDPYRRKLTVEAWVRNVVLFRQQQEAAQENSDDYGNSDPGGVSDDASLRRLVLRRGVDKATWWEFGLCDGGHLFLSFAGQTVTAETKIANAAAWQHVAFTVDISSPKHAVVKLFLQADCVASKEIHSLDANQKLLSAATKALAAMDSGNDAVPPPLSTLVLGHGLTDYEMTEVRVWATARTAEQLSDMKENYLGIAEAKRRMKIAIHQRNCKCEKCMGRRTNKTQVRKVALLGAAFPTTPPSSSASARDRRRPQPKA